MKWDLSDGVASVLSAAVRRRVHHHIEWSVKPLSWLITDCLHCGQVSTQLRALQRVGAVIIQVQVVCAQAPLPVTLFPFFPLFEKPKITCVQYFT